MVVEYKHANKSDEIGYWREKTTFRKISLFVHLEWGTTEVIFYQINKKKQGQIEKKGR